MKNLWRWKGKLYIFNTKWLKIKEGPGISWESFISYPQTAILRMPPDSRNLSKENNRTCAQWCTRCSLKPPYNSKNVRDHFKVLQKGMNVKKWWFTHTKEYHAAIKNNDVDLNTLISKGVYDTSLNDKSRWPVSWYDMISVM